MENLPRRCNICLFIGAGRNYVQLNPQCIVVDTHTCVRHGNGYGIPAENTLSAVLYFVVVVFDDG